MSPVCVVDASVAAKWFLDEPGQDAAEDLLRSEARLVAPALVLIELGNILWKQQQRGVITPEDAAEMFGAAPRYFSELVDDRALVQKALALSLDHAHPIYDCLYLALAVRLDSRLVTADERLIRKFEGTAHAPRLVHVRDWRG